jgi:hypothetical protein
VPSLVRISSASSSQYYNQAARSFGTSTYYNTIKNSYKSRNSITEKHDGPCPKRSADKAYTQAQLSTAVQLAQRFCASAVLYGTIQVYCIACCEIWCLQRCYRFDLSDYVAAANTDCISCIVLNLLIVARASLFSAAVSSQAFAPSHQIIACTPSLK